MVRTLSIFSVGSFTDADMPALSTGKASAPWLASATEMKGGASRDMASFPLSVFDLFVEPYNPITMGTAINKMEIAKIFKLSLFLMLIHPFLVGLDNSFVKLHHNPKFYLGIYRKTND
jgi:hypothetical protein